MNIIKQSYCVMYNLVHNLPNFNMLPLLVRGGVKCSRFKNCQVIGKKCGKISIGKNCFLSGTRFYMTGKNNTIVLGDRVVINASKQQPTYINACEGTTITIGDYCLFSNNIEIHTTDYHKILKGNERANRPSNISIGNHCWIGLRCIILKGSVIPDNSVIGCCSLVNKKFTENNSMIAGVPAKVINHCITWNH